MSPRWTQPGTSFKVRLWAQVGGGDGQQDSDQAGWRGAQKEGDATAPGVWASRINRRNFSLSSVKVKRGSALPFVGPLSRDKLHDMKDQTQNKAWSGSNDLRLCEKPRLPLRGWHHFRRPSRLRSCVNINTALTSDSLPRR